MYLALIIIQTLPPGFGNTDLIESRYFICCGLNIPRYGLTSGMRSTSNSNPGPKICAGPMTVNLTQRSHLAEGS
jgi:hypothetical protein